ncbi:MAG: CBS domain-containing protein [Pleurocapsa sp.]
MNLKFQYQSLKPADVIEPNPPTFHSSGGVMEAIAQMNRNNTQDSRRYSYVLILEESKLVGILTEPDIV